MSKDRNKDPRVVNMNQFADSARYQPLREVEGYWDAIRAGRLVPRRSDIDPRGIERALEFAFVLERIAPGLGRVRIAGSHLTDLLGMEVRGMPLSAMFAAQARTEIGDALEQVFAGPAKAELSLSGEKALGKPTLEGKMILLPLKSDLGDITRVLGCLVTHGKIGRVPRRFDITKTHVTPLLGDAHLTGAEDERTRDKAYDLADPVSEPVRELAEEAEPFEPGPRPYLRLVKTDHSG